MPVPTVRVPSAAEEAAAVGAVVLAFSTDPMARWCWPAPHTYLATMPRFTRAFAGGAFVHGGAFCSGDFAGAALWLKPGVAPDEQTMGEIAQATVSDDIRQDLFAVMEQMGRSHPHEAHWYLPLIGVDPARQGQGYGDALMRYALEQCDRQHLPAYLESTNPRNITLYRRHGFEELGRIQVGRSPTLVPMLRPAR
ncbi:MAG TPA: N-acetyltransferase [Vicinamibacterales bacterium]|nr:N-acetyltransferase [Vicinamibacterales bacterium]